MRKFTAPVLVLMAYSQLATRRALASQPLRVIAAQAHNILPLLLSSHPLVEQHCM